MTFPVQDMEVVQPYAEKYLMKLTFYADNYHAFHSGFVKETHTPTHTVCVRLTNTTEKPLTKQNLQSVALSIPDLHYRLTGHAYAADLLHLGNLETEHLPLDFSRLARPTSTLSRSSIPLTKISLCEEHGSEGDSRSITTIDWICCDGSFVPDFPGTEWTSVNNGGVEFIRAFSRISQTSDAADILGRCNITDYTAYEQFVCSVDMDILNIEDPSRRKELCPTSDKGATSHYKKEERKSSWKETNGLERKGTSLNNWKERISVKPRPHPGQ
ncbi:hypothetical protein DPEC_G00113410 [Dallia pectoralis]|uniref:Uncharacterized protein n=1 Tax=Dallia pectoralis TaxID=75939 RepID=A0ACC2GTU0_DALPE|nr:hypothetical protein DPEC_G00113410 [Dallia pectoralis]